LTRERQRLANVVRDWERETERFVREQWREIDSSTVGEWCSHAELFSRHTEIVTRSRELFCGISRTCLAVVAGNSFTHPAQVRDDIRAGGSARVSAHPTGIATGAEVDSLAEQ